MKMTISKDNTMEDDYVDIRYRELNASITQIVDICNGNNQLLLGEIDGKKYPLDINDIYYFESVDGRTCACAAKDVYNSEQTLAQLEQTLGGYSFVRISKSMLVNIRKVKWVSSMLNMKLAAELINGERVAVSRHYRSNMLNMIYKMGEGANK